MPRVVKRSALIIVAGVRGLVVLQRGELELMGLGQGPRRCCFLHTRAGSSVQLRERGEHEREGSGGLLTSAASPSWTRTAVARATAGSATSVLHSVWCRRATPEDPDECAQLLAQLNASQRLGGGFMDRVKCLEIARKSWASSCVLVTRHRVLVVRVQRPAWARALRAAVTMGNNSRGRA
jgi:hypothetical protein